MKPSELIYDKVLPKEDKFGLFFKWKRIELKLSLDDLANKMEITKDKLRAIENGKVRASSLELKQLAKIFRINDEEERGMFFELAGMRWGEWVDINDYVAENPEIRELVRAIKDRELSKEDINRIINDIKYENVNE